MAQQKSNIPIVKPSEFDEYLFSNWKAPVFALYEKFHIAHISTYKNHLSLPTAPHRRSVNFFIFLTHGKVLRTKGLSQYEILPNTFFFLPANQITAIDYVSDDAEGFYCHFLSEILYDFDENKNVLKSFSFFENTHEPTIQIIENERVDNLLNILINEYQRNESNRFELISKYLNILFLEVKLQNKEMATSPKNASAMITQRYKNGLAEQIYELKTVSEFAKYLQISPNHLHKSVKNTTGKTAQQLLNEMRLLEAKVLLRQTALTISEIAYKIGKYEPSDFSRFFKSRTNITPNQYRNKQY